MGEAQAIQTPITFARDGILATSLPTYDSLGGVSWRTTGWQFAIVAIVIVGFSLAPYLTGPASAKRSGVSVPFIVVVWGLVLLGASSARKKRAQEYLKKQPNEWGVTIAEAMAATEPFEPLTAVEARWRRLTERADRPVMIVDESVAPALACIPLRSELIEPEPINQSARGALAAAYVFIALALIDATQFRTKWWKIAIYCALTVWFLLQVPVVRDRIPGLRDTGRDLIAGPGWLRDRRGRRWTVADSIAIVMRTRQGKNKPGVIMRFVGPAGARDVSFASASNQDLALLWERWMHPNPRIELEA